MNLKAPYEIIIATKLEQELPVPDMSDAIWARIELQLTDVPSAEADASAGPDMIAGATITGKTLAIVIGCVLALLILFFVLKSKIKNQQKLRVPPPLHQPGKVIDYPPLTGPVSSKINAAGTITIKKINSKEKNLLQSEAALILKKDSANTLPPAILVPDPYSTNIAQPVKRNMPDSLREAPVLKRPTGVPLSNNDGYKVTSERSDSVKPRN